MREGKTMRCPACGHQNAPNARFCANCGLEISSATDSSLAPGQTMNAGQYRVVKQLGRGGMGAIYLAENLQAFNRLCVIKEMIAYYEPGKEREARERFEHEARILATLKHPGIPDMYGFFSERGHNYIVMEYIEGEALENAVTHENRAGELVLGKLLSVEDVVRYGVEICRVLVYLSQIKPEPVVHCDIKPANIIVDRNSHQAVLVDFGTAKARYLAGMLNKPDAQKESVYGTVGYAAPEQYRGQAVPKSDVFSLAATLYHLLTDDDPRDHPFKWSQMERIPQPLRSILERALATDVDQRPDAAQLQQELEAYRAAQTGALRPPLTFPDNNLATTLTGVLDLALRYWDYARQMLYDGRLPAWLRQTLNDSAAASRAEAAIREFPDAPDAGLDEFVRSLNPRMPAPQLSLSARAVELAVAAGGRASAEIVLTNGGPGGSHGALVASEVWLRTDPARYALGPGQSCPVRLEVVADQLLPGKKYIARVAVKPSVGQALEAEVRAEVRRQAAAPSVRRAPAPSRGGNRRWLTYFAILPALLVAGYVIVRLVPEAVPSSFAYPQGIAALRQGDWAKASGYLAGLDAGDRERVREVAQLLNEMMVPVAGGTLRMGREDGSTDERPVHDVQVADLLVDRFEVTNVQYQYFVNETAHPAPRGWAGGRYPRGKALHPVVGVTWQDALDYAAWARKRLPSEAEWEWAARGAEGWLFPWGNTIDPSRANSGKPDKGGTMVVGSFSTGASPQGIMDLVGNVREWTADLYGPYREPHAPPAQGTRIAVRGSSWRTYNDVVTARESVEAASQADDLGFRCVRNK